MQPVHEELEAARAFVLEKPLSSAPPPLPSPTSQPLPLINSESRVLNCGPGCCLGLAIERERHGRDSGEIRRLLNSLECKQDEYAKSMILHSITRCVYLLEAEVRRAGAPPVSLAPGLLLTPHPTTARAASSDLSLRLVVAGGGLRDLGDSGPRTPAVPVPPASPHTL